MPSVALTRSPSLTNIKLTSLKRNVSKDRKAKKLAAEVDLSQKDGAEPKLKDRSDSVDDRELKAHMVSFLSQSLPLSGILAWLPWYSCKAWLGIN